MERKTILIADDSTINRTFVSSVLEEDYDVLEASNGKEAMDILLGGNDQISALLLDLMMPVMNGYEVLQAMADADLLEQVPVVVITSEDDSSIELKALELGATDFLTKPIEPRIARRRIKTVIEQRELEDLRLQSRLLVELQYRADHDELTGIYSKDAFYRSTMEMLNDPANADKTYYLIRWNINRFKLINELFGWDEGNNLLKDAAKQLATGIGERGTYGRIDSDHFVECLSLESPDAIERIIASAKEWTEGLSVKQMVSISAGIYPVTDKDLPVNQMCDRAAMALTTISSSYAVSYAFYDDALRQQMVEEQDIIDNMQAALDNGEFEAFLQPVYSVAEGRPASAESLVRWRRPGVGLVSPGVFIPLFERNGFISALDHFMWEQVCKILRDRKDKGLTELPISVNVSRRSMYDPNLCEFIFNLTKKYDIEPRLLRIEVTESAYMDNPTQLIATVKRLQEYGFLVLMDDFGSGYSSFNTLKDIPVDILKIDMAFMEGFESGGRVATILASILRMSKWLGIPVIAEGVETTEQSEFLGSIGCDYIQGFFYARPMPYQDFVTHVAQDTAEKNVEKLASDVEFVNEIIGGNLAVDRVINGMFDAFALFEFADDDVEIVRANDGFMQLFECDKAIFAQSADELSLLLAPDHRQDFSTMIHNVAHNHKSSTTTTAHENADGSIVDIQATCSFLGGKDGFSIFGVAFSKL